MSLLSGPRTGLGAAYVRGLNHALAHHAPDVVIQMDADFSHNPSDLPRLLAAIDDGAEVAIGSRYLGGNRTPHDWGWRRRLLSRAGNLVARHWLGLAPVHDCTAGFRAWRASALRAARFTDVSAQGYVFIVAMLQNAARAGADIREVPVHFPDRRLGTSKLGTREIVEFARWALAHGAPAMPRTGLAEQQAR
ncbi:Glycosyltransferase family protein [Aromatoleum petrolei]|nr:Glycosyltransferase family protein [Aromatoleum petrolei]